MNMNLFKKLASVTLFAITISTPALAANVVMNTTVNVDPLPITTTVIQSTSFGDIVKPNTPRTCILTNTGLLAGQCTDTANAQPGLIDVVGTANSAVQISGTSSTVDGLTYIPTFGDGTSSFVTTYITALTGDGTLTVNVGGSLGLDPSQMIYGKTSLISSNVTITYN